MSRGEALREIVKEPMRRWFADPQFTVRAKWLEMYDAVQHVAERNVDAADYLLGISQLTEPTQVSPAPLSHQVGQQQSNCRH